MYPSSITYNSITCTSAARNANILLFMAENTYLAVSTCVAYFPSLLYYLIIEEAI